MPRHSPLPPEFTGVPFAVGAALASGVSPKRLRGSDLHAPFHGVRVASAPTDVTSLCRAYAERMPEHAFFCGATAARLLDVPLPWELERDATVHVGVPAPRRALVGAGVAGRSVTVRPGDIVLRNGMRATSPERTWCELAGILDLPDLVAVGDFLIHHRRPLTGRTQLEHAVAHYPGRHGRALLRTALPLLDERSESRRESHLRVVIRGGGIRGLVSNLWIVTSGGYRYRADLAVPARKAVIEYQSDYHGDLAQFRRDMTRRARLEADGWAVILVNADDLRDPEELVARIRTQLASRPLTPGATS